MKSLSQIARQNKFILGGILCMAFQLAQFGAAAAPVDKIYEDRDTRTITVTGNLGTARANQKTIIEVINQGRSIADVDPAKPTPLPYGDTIAYVDFFTADSTGAYSYSFKLDEAKFKSGTYTLRIGGTDVAPSSLQFSYYDSDTVNAFIANIRAATDLSVVKTSIEENQELIDLNFAPYTRLRSNNKIDAVYAMIYNSIKNGDITYTIAGIGSKIKDCSALVSIREDVPRDIKTTIDSYGDVLRINGEAAYRLFQDDDVFGAYNQDNIHDKRLKICEALKNTAYTDISDFKPAFRDKVIASAVSNTEWGTVEKVILYEDLLDLNLSPYNGLAGKEQVCRNLAAKTYVSESQFVDAFYDEVNKQYKKEHSSSLSSGGGSSGASTTYAVNAVPEPAIAFDDISGVAWAAESINTLAAKGIVSGVGGRNFNPLQSVKREEFLKMLLQGYRMVDDSAVCSFTDVKQSDWYYKYVATAEKLGITNGNGDGTFGVGKEITRQEMAALCYRVALIQKVSLPSAGTEAAFDDADAIAPYALDAVKAIRQMGVINGVGENRFAPLQNATRAEAAKVICGLLRYTYKI